MGYFLALGIPLSNAKGLVLCCQLSLSVPWDTFHQYTCYLPQYPAADSASVTEMWPVTIVPVGHWVLSKAWISFWNFPWGSSVPPNLCSHSLHGQPWILFISDLPHPNGPSPCLGKSSNTLLTEKWPKGDYKQDTRIKPVLYPGAARYYWHFWFTGVGSGWPKRQLGKSTLNQSSNGR